MRESHLCRREPTRPTQGSGSAAGPMKGGRKVLMDYTITGPTLEEVFMNVARESGVAGGV